MSNQNSGKGQSKFQQRCASISKVAGMVKAGWRDVGLVFAECIDHYNESSKDGVLIAKLANALNGEGGNKTMAKAIKGIAFEYWGVKTGRNANGSDRSKNSAEQYGKHTDTARNDTLQLLREGKLIEVTRILDGNREEGDNNKVNEFKMTKEMKASPEFTGAFRLGTTLYAIKEKAGRDATLTMIERQIQALMAQAEEHLDGLNAAKPAIGAKLAGDEEEEKEAA